MQQCHIKPSFRLQELGTPAPKKSVELMNFQASFADLDLYIAHQKDGIIYMLVYVDDIVIAAKDMASASIKED